LHHALLAKLSDLGVLNSEMPADLPQAQHMIAAQRVLKGGAIW
jgi:hypothetical protein